MIPAWGNAPGSAGPTSGGLKARLNAADGVQRILAALDDEGGVT